MAHLTKLEIEDYPFEFVEQGDGQPVLFVHGSASDWRTWKAQLDAFGATYHAMAYSRRYHWPNRPIPAGADYSMNEQVDDLMSLIGELHVAPVNLVGHSYGAFLSLLVAIRRPDLVRSLTLTEPPLVTLYVTDPPKLIQMLWLFVTHPQTAASIVSFGAQGLQPCRKALLANRPEDALQIFGKAVLGADAFRRLSEIRLTQARANFIKAEFLGSGMESVNEDECRRIQAPALLLNGAWSPRLFHHISEHLCQLLPDVKRLTIPRASHIVHEDNPSAFNTTTLQFLAKQSSETVGHFNA